VRKIVVPTDGSPESERALAIARGLAWSQGAELVLARVVEPTIDALTSAGGEVSAEAYDRFSEAVDAAAQAELARLAGQSGAEELQVRTALLAGPVESALLDFELKERPDLVVMATHGRTGLARFTLGSVADRLVREGTVPVLVIRRSSESSVTLERALLMLDGSALAEEAVPVTRALIGRPIRFVRLFRAVAGEAERPAAQAYLDGVAAMLADDGATLDTAVDVGDPRRAVERLIEDIDLVVICTHGRGGFDRLRHGSVAAYVTHHIDRPTLLVRAGMVSNDG